MKYLFSAKKWICLLLSFFILFTQIISLPVAYAITVEPAEAPNDPESIYDLVVLVVDSKVKDDEGSYLGLRYKYPGKLTESDLDSRIERYAKDLSAEYDLTDTKILTFDGDKDTVADLAEALENMYLNGDGTLNNRLAGVVLIGDIPLPVVNKNGNRYVSVFPYTDFTEKAYIYNPLTNNYERNEDVEFPKPEIWHGVIRAPGASANDINELATFLDKNHLYYEDVEEYSKFDRKLFFGDLIHEEEQMNKDSYSHYIDYLNAFEDLAYLRYNKHWAKTLMKDMMADVPINEDHPMNQGEDGFAAGLEGDPMGGMPDIYTKKMIDNSLIPYYKVFSNFISKLNDFTDYTARYNPSTTDNVPELITMKDEYAKFYLKSVGGALEKRFNEVVSIIQEPLPLLDYSTLSGYYDSDEDEEFVIDYYEPTAEELAAAALDPLDPFALINFLASFGDTDDFKFRFHYLNEELNKLYINGVDADLLDGESAKLCGMYLGSTKDAYFDNEKNYDPKALADGEYSILTRAMRSNNFATGLPTPTAGVHTRMLSPKDLFSKTQENYGGQYNDENIYETGAVVEGVPAYGISPFIDNPLSGNGTNYKNPFDFLAPGDVVISINGKNLSYAHTFDQAIEASFDTIVKVIDRIEDNNLNQFDNFPYKIVVNSDFDTTILKTPNEIKAHFAGNTGIFDKGDKVAGLMSVDYYHNGALQKKELTYTVQIDSDNMDIKYTSKEHPNGLNNGEEILVILSDKALPIQNPWLPTILPDEFAGWDDPTDGAIFTLYQNKDLGYDSKAYEGSAGCNAASAYKNSDRCLSMVATIPVLDAGGATAPAKTIIPLDDDPATDNAVTRLMFPENVKKNNATMNSGYGSDYTKHVNQFQFPPGYHYEDVDELTYDMCYSGLPAADGGLNSDANPYTYPLDPSTANGDGESINFDYYGQLLKKFGQFTGSDLHDQSDNVDDDSEDETDDNAGYQNHVKAFDPANTIYGGIHNLNASQITVSSDGSLDLLDGPKVTLKDFTDFYGLWDGKDNDGDGFADFNWIDENNDGVYETRYYDYDEANPIYGLPSSNLDRIGRLMLSHASTYTVPFGNDSFRAAPYNYNKFDEDITLKVVPHSYGNKKISSMIVHNEPTKHTIQQQILAQTTADLPIDNPRYVSFMAPPEQKLPYPTPQPVNVWVDVDGIIDDIETEAPYVPGEIHKIYYPNLFSDEIEGIEDLATKLSFLAEQLAATQGSYRIIPGATESDYDVSDPADLLFIKNYILQHYFTPVISGVVDDPISGFDLKTATTNKLHDALMWESSNIDEKHEYVLKYYLNDHSTKNAFINDSTLYPAPFGYDPAYGYEAAYLVLDGENDYFDMSFNKDLPEEGNVAFDSLAGKVAGGHGDEDGEEEGGDKDKDGAGKDGDDVDFEYVWLPQFLVEVMDFVGGFASVPTFQDSCGLSQSLAEGDEDSADKPQLPLTKLTLSVDKDVVSIAESDTITVNIVGYNANDEIVGSGSNTELITLNIAQNSDDPIFTLSDSSEKPLLNGHLTYTLNTTELAGTVTLEAENKSGIKSNDVDVSAVATNVKLYSYIYFEIEGMDELQELIEAEEKKAAEEAKKKEEEEKKAAEEAAEKEIIDDGIGDGIDDGLDDGVDDGIGESATHATDGEGVTDDDGDGISDSDGTGDGDEDDGGVPHLFARETPDEDDATTEDTTPDEGDGVTDGTDDLDGDLDGDGISDGDGTGDGEDLTVKDIEVLESTLVEEITLESTPVVEEEDEVTEGDEEVATGTEQEEETISDDLEWEEYFILEKYYEKYLGQELESKARRLLVENYSDRMLALQPGDINPFEDAYHNDESPYIIDHGDEFVAGGSLMKIEAQILDENGQVEMDKALKVKFSLIDLTVGLPVDEILTFYTYGNAGFKESNIVDTEEGIATIYLESGEKSGNFMVMAEVLNLDGSENKAYPTPEKELYIVADEPDSVWITSDSYVLLANNQSKTPVTVTVKDQFGNIAENTFSKVALFVDDLARIDESKDENASVIGTQFSVFGEGFATLDLYAKDTVGEVSVIALVMDYELENLLLELDNNIDDIDFTEYVGTSKKFEILQEMDLGFTLQDANLKNSSSITADGSSFIRIGTTLKSGGEVVKKYSGPIDFKIITDKLGAFKPNYPTKLTSGLMHAANLKFISSTLAGDVEILVDIPGFISETVKFKTNPGPPTKIDLSATETSIHTNAQNNLGLKANILDKNDNLVTSNNKALVHFGATDATKDLVEFSPVNSISNSGIANSSVVGKQMSGEANILATSGDLEPGHISLKVTKHVTSNVVKSFQPRSLYISLLGGSFAKIDDGDNLAQTMLNSGQVQAVSAITASPSDSKRLIGVDGFGKIDLLSETIETDIVPSTRSFPWQKIVFSDKLDDKELASFFLIPKKFTPLVLLDDQDISEPDGIYVKPLTLVDPQMEINSKSDGIYIEKAGDIKAKIDKSGRISISDDQFTIELPDENLQTSNFTLVIEQSGNAVVSVTYKQTFSGGVNSLTPNEILVPTPGFYVRSKSYASKHDFISSFSGSSTANPSGLYMVDTEFEIESSQAAGFAQTSLEDSRDEYGLGFKGENKHMLFFAAGNSVGESHMPYASEVGIIFGDPMIRLEVEDDLISDGTGYSKDIGKPIYTGNQEIIEMVDFDYNGDDYDDLLLVYESGQIRLLENEITNSRFRDRGVILNIPDGITSMTKIDFNNDAFDDLVVGTKLSCRVDDECITLFENVDGHFERKPLNLALNGKKAYEMASDDMNADGCADIVIADSSGSISVFYNEIVNSACNGLDLDVGYTNNFGYVLDSDANLAEQIFIHYDGMETPVQDDASDGEVDENHSNLHKFIQFILPSSDPPPIVEEPDAEGLNAGQYAADAAAFADALNSNPNLASSSVPPMQYPTEYDFIHLPEDARVLTSTKTATDLNGEAVGEGDEISYLITLKNTSGSSISDLMLSDATPASMTFLEDSLECLDVNCPDDLELVETGTSLRSHVFKGISVPAHGQRVIQYKMKVLVMPKVKFDIGNNFTNYPSGNNDAYLDILVKPAVNPDGILTYIHSSGKYANGHVNYKVFKKPSVNTDTSGPLKDAFEDLGLPDPMALLGFDPAAGEVPEDLQGQVMDIVAKQAWDADYDGCNDDWFGKSNADMGVDADGDGEIDGAGGGAGGGGSAGKGSAAGSIADSVEGALGALRCSGGGCLPIPYNFAFFAPDDATPGIAAMAFGTPNIPFFMPFYPSTSPSSFRIYVNPTLTMGLGGGLCGGTGPAAVCFPYAVPGGLPGASGLCDALTTGIDEAVSSAKDSVVNADQATVISDGEPAGQSGASGGSFGSADDPMSAAVSTNIKIPGFPSVLTNWMDKQMDEIYNKLLDFPDLYIVYPDLTSLFKIKDPPADGNQEVDFLGLHDFLTKVSSVPIISIEGKEVLIRVPAISPKEIQQFNQEAAKWVEFHQKEWERFKDFNCSVEDELNPERRNFCDKITADVGNLVQSVQELMDLMDKIANLPRDILTYRHAEAKYATQIICYMDAIINFTGGWFKRQEGRIKAWRKSIQDAIRTFSDWQLILDVVAEYQASCDQCKSDRFGKLALLMQLFAAIPEPPIIPLPKWPDIIVDLSQIRTGVKILWPDVVFKPQLISLPALPYFTLPDILPDIDLDLDIPEISVPDFPDFVLPNLPDLPPLPLPTLPDLPRPPRIPALPDVVADLAVGLKTIFKILCLLKNGFILIPETKLATEIETLTQPSVQAVLPFTKHLGTQIPPIQYDAWKEVHITGKLNFKIDSSIIHIAAEKAAQVWNKNIKLFINGLNRYLELPYGQMISSAVQKAIDAAEKAALEATLEAIEDAIEDDEDSVDEAVDDTEEDKKDEGAESSLPFAFTEFNDAVKEMELVLNEYIAATDLDTPDSYTLTATETLLDINHPLLNRTIDEIEADILKRDNPDTPSASHLADVRNEMIAYVKGLNNSIDLLEQIDDYEEFTRVLVDTDESSSKIAALTTDYGEISGRSTTEKMSLLGSAAEELILDSAFKDHRELIAGLADYDPADVASGDASTGVPPIGIYIVTKDGVNENILSYTPELKKNTSFIYSDVDDDLDDDIILSMGTNVYLKENHEKDNPLPKGKFISSLSKDDVSDYVTDGGVAVQGVSSPYESHDKADISWLPIHGTVAYEVIIRNSIDSSLINPIAKYIALPNSIEDSSSVDILNYLNIPIPGPDEDDGSVLELTNADLPAISVELKNGNYYASVFALNSNGNRSLRSDYSFVAPQSCADKEPPFPVIGSADLNVSIYKDLEIDASGSFDADGEVVEYYIEMLPYETDKTDPNTGEKLRTTPMPKYFWSDLNVTVDSDGDGLTMNDRNNPEFRIGPFVHEGDIGKHPAILHVVDQSGNSSAMDLDINVFAPDISLDPTFARTSVATGETDPKVPILPFSLMRNRYIYRLVGEEIKLVPRTDKIKDGLTFEDGSYEIDDFNLENMILVENSDKEIIAEIHPDTGDIGALQPGYSTVTVPASLPNTPTQVDIVDSNGIVLGSVIAVADANTDVQIHEELGIDSTNFKEMTGVNIDDLDIADKFEFVSLPANDPNHPGGAVLVNVTEEKLLTLIDAAGNIMILDDRITIVQKQNQHTADPLIIQILFNGNAVGDVFVSTSQGDSSLQTSSGSTIIGPNDVPFATPRPPSTKTLYGNDVFGGPFNDMPSDLKALALDLFNKGIIDADKDALGGLQLDTEALVKRKEFVKTLLKLLCIIPRPEAHEPDTIYTDLPFEDDFFPYVKEGTLLDLVEGYKGEIDPVSGKLPFKPDNTITRAEAVKIILEALEMQGIITLETLVEGEPWYETFMEAAQDLNPYVVSGAILENNFIITPEEAVAPNKEMTFGELMLMADRVLDFYNCFEIDDDNDGMSDFCELKYDIDDPEADIDQDGLKNADECFYGLDPRDKDTDKGGVFDGEEVALGTNGLDDSDDSADDDNDGLTNRAEILIHGTDPNNPDTDGGGVIDGDEVKNLTDPNVKNDDDGGGAGDAGDGDGGPREGEEGIYIIPASCDTCPCISTFLNKAEIIPGDVFFPVISKYYEEYYDSKPHEKLYIFSKGNEVTVQSVTK